MAEKRLHATIRGRVQGVGFRYFVRESARQFNITGWTRNRFDDSVEVIAEGNEGNLESFVTELNKGPSMSEVTNVDIEWSDYVGGFGKFKIRMTG